MDSQGFLAPPGVFPCRVCGKPLNPNGHRPAETYAGTFTGECYSCQSRPFFPTLVTTDSGGTYMSHPPSCPSWRRDRETYLAFADCETCKGGGRVRARGVAGGGGNVQQCEDCLSRHNAHPATIEENRANKARHDATSHWEKTVIREIDRRLRLLGKKFDTIKDEDPDWEPTRSAVLAEAPSPPLGEDQVQFPAGWGVLEKKKSKKING